MRIGSALPLHRLDSVPEADDGASEKHYYVRVSKKDHYYQTLIVPIFLTDPYIVVIADRGRGEGEGETLSWSEGEERERGRQVWGEGNKTQKSVEGGSVAEKHATLASISSRYGADHNYNAQERRGGYIHRINKYRAGWLDFAQTE